MVNGKELCNCIHRVNDPIDQLERFQDQLKLSEKGDDEAMFIDLDFVACTGIWYASYVREWELHRTA
jgi:lysyl-tRNA synthetase class II